ncbi:hypothetical protein ACLB2K_014008 [Fragaria x ananassa]
MAESSDHLERETRSGERREPIVARTPEVRGNSRGAGRYIQEETPEGEPRDLNSQEIAEAMEGMRAQIARLEQQRVRDQEETSGRERMMEKENATLLRAMSRGIGQREALDRATDVDMAADPKTMHIGTNLFLDEMREDGLRLPDWKRPGPRVHPHPGTRN